MRQLLSFLGLLATGKFDNLRTPVWGIEELSVTSNGETVIMRKLQYGSIIEEEFYFPEHGKLIRMFEGRVQTFQEQEEGR